MTGGATLLAMTGGATLLAMTGGPTLLAMTGGATLLVMTGGATLLAMTGAGDRDVAGTPRDGGGVAVHIAMGGERYDNGSSLCCGDGACR